MDTPVDCKIVAVGCDHAGLTAKRRIVDRLGEYGIDVRDFGTDSEESADYPDYAVKVAKAVSKGECDRGILVCGTGVGMSMVANKVPGVRSALCYSPRIAELSRLHNNANVLALPGREAFPDELLAIVDIWLKTGFEGGRHARRVEKIHELTGI